MSSIKVRLSIAGGNYIVSTTESEGYVLGLAKQLDEDIDRILENTPSASVTQAAVVAALDYLDEMKKNVNNADHMRSQINGYLKDAAESRAELEEARREIARLRGELQTLKGGKA